MLALSNRGQFCGEQRSKLKDEYCGFVTATQHNMAIGAKRRTAVAQKDYNLVPLASFKTLKHGKA
jgi:hypothetical protein